MNNERPRCALLGGFCNKKQPGMCIEPLPDSQEICPETELFISLVKALSGPGDILVCWPMTNKRGFQLILKRPINQETQGKAQGEERYTTILDLELENGVINYMRVSHENTPRKNK